MKPIKNQLKEAFEKFHEFQGRTKKRTLKDQLYMGIFKDTLEKKGFPLNYIHKALKDNLLEKCFIRPGTNVRAGYLYIGEEVGRNKALELIRKIWLKAKKLV